MSKTAIIGASGFIGSYLINEYRKEYPDTVGTTFSSANDALNFFDIRNPNLTALKLEDLGTKAVIITSAKANVDYCETNREIAYDVNVRGLLALIEQIGKTSMQCIFLSTDYVFEGSTGSYLDNHPTMPTTEYGRQKVAVETAIPSLTDNFMIIRLSKIFGLEKNDGTLLDGISCALSQGKEILAAADQFFCPTFVIELITAIKFLQDRQAVGTFNLCSPEPWSRYNIALELAKMIGADPALVRKISLHDIHSMKNRPLNTSMICSLSADDCQHIFSPLLRHLSTSAKYWKISN